MHLRKDVAALGWFPNVLQLLYGCHCFPLYALFSVLFSGDVKVVLGCWSRWQQRTLLQTVRAPSRLSDDNLTSHTARHNKCQWLYSILLARSIFQKKLAWELLGARDARYVSVILQLGGRDPDS